MRAALVAAVLAVAGCADLSRLPAEVCGNGVLEAGEDCDVIAGATNADSCVACRLACDPVPLVPDPDDPVEPDPLECPPEGGWGCGQDGVCRHGTGIYDEMFEIDEETVDLELHDVDGDGRIDVLGYGLTEAWLYTGRPGFELVPRGRVQNRVLEHGPPSFGRLDGDAMLDVVFVPGKGRVAVVVGGEEGLEPAPQPWQSLIGGGVIALPMVTVTSAPYAELMQIIQVGDELELRVVRDGIGVLDFLRLPVPPDAQWPPVTLVAEIDGVGEAQELILGFEGQPEVYVIRATFSVGGPQPAIEAQLAMPPGHPLRRLMTGDIDSDALIDVIAGDGAGGVVFRQTSPGVFGAPELEDRVGVILAARDLDGDSDCDLVSDAGIFRSNTVAFERVVIAIQPWTDAVIADLNQDGDLDVAAISFEGVETQLGGPEGLFSRWLQPLNGASRVVTGDFDGDRVADLAVYTGADVEPEVELLYGRVPGGPGPPVPLGEFGALASFAAARFERDDGSLPRDDVSELFVQPVVLDPAPKWFSLFVGGSAGKPVAAIDAGIDAVRVVIGRFDAGPEADILVLPAARASGARLIRGGGGGQFAVEDIVRVELGTADPLGCEFDQRGVPMATGDLDGDGLDELVRGACGDSQERIEISRVTGADGDTLALEQVVMLEAPRNWHGVYRLRLVDVDADTDLDLVASFVPIADLVGVAVYWNDGGTLGADPSFDRDLAGVTGIEVANVDDDPEPELLLGGERLVAVSFDAERNMESVELRADTPGVARVADLDGDGVGDLVIGEGSLRVFRAIPHDELD